MCQKKRGKTTIQLHHKSFLTKRPEPFFSPEFSNSGSWQRN